jgi:hypothetical protein
MPPFTVTCAAPVIAMVWAFVCNFAANGNLEEDSMSARTAKLRLHRNPTKRRAFWIKSKHLFVFECDLYE